jgi:hypothetical protein
MMTANEFAYWLQGFAELNGAPPTAEQWQGIRDHLQLVFKKVTPPINAQAPGLGQIIPYGGNAQFNPAQNTRSTC